MSMDVMECIGLLEQYVYVMAATSRDYGRLVRWIEKER